jgi:hypothetical protein
MVSVTDSYSLVKDLEEDQYEHKEVDIGKLRNPESSNKSKGKGK